MLDYVWLILLFPLLGVLANALVGRWIGRRAVAAVASLAVGASFKDGGRELKGRSLLAVTEPDFVTHIK